MTNPDNYSTLNVVSIRGLNERKRIDSVSDYSAELAVVELFEKI